MVEIAEDVYDEVVAPLAGAWIETSVAEKVIERVSSRPSRARGLKPLNTNAP